MRRVLPILVVGLTACLELGQQPASESTETTGSTAALGRYEVTASLDTQTCGTGSIVFPETLTFVIELDEEDKQLVWGDGALALRGRLAANGVEFSVEAKKVVDARDDTQAENLPPCLIERTDAVQGALDDPEAPTGFEATLEIDYAPEAGSDCEDLLFGPNRLVQALPCQARYELVGSRSD